MVLLVYALNNSRSQSILWLLEEMGVEYQIEQFKRTSEGLAPPELEKVHPLGKSPVINDNGRKIAETGTIIEYLVNKYGPQLGPDKSDEDSCLKYSYWLHFAEGSAMPPLVMYIIFKAIVTRSPFFLRPITKLISGAVNKSFIMPNINRQTAYMEAELAKNPQNWFVKDFSGADVMMSFPLIGTANHFDMAKYPHLAQFLSTVRERPAYKRAMEKAGGEFTM